jgi:ATP-binding cassette, subfamily F, member 3
MTLFITELSRAVESSSLVDAQRIVLDIRLERRRTELVEARKIAARRSGARGKEARLAEIQAEQNVKEIEDM